MEDPPKVGEQEISNAVDYFSHKGRRAKATALWAEFERERRWWVAMGKDATETRHDWERKDTALARWWQSSLVQAVRGDPLVNGKLPMLVIQSNTPRERAFNLQLHKTWATNCDVAEYKLMQLFDTNLQRMDRANMRDILSMNFRQQIDRGISMTCTRFGNRGVGARQPVLHKVHAVRRGVGTQKNTGPHLEI